MIKRLDNAMTELRHYRAFLDRNRWRSDIQERITKIDIIEQIIRSMDKTLPEHDDATHSA